MTYVWVWRVFQDTRMILWRDYRGDLLGEGQRRAGFLRFVQLAVLQGRRYQHFSQDQSLSHFSGTGQKRLLRGQFLDEVEGFLVTPGARRQTPPVMRRVDHTEFAPPFGIEQVFPLFGRVLGGKQFGVI